MSSLVDASLQLAGNKSFDPATFRRLKGERYQKSFIRKIRQHLIGVMFQASSGTISETCCHVLRSGSNVCLE